jgi:hypothetical protein
MPVLGIAFLADFEYGAAAALNGMTAGEAQAATLNSMDGLYRREGIATFQIGAFITDPTNTKFNVTGTDKLFDAMMPVLSAAGLDLSNPAVRVARGITLGHLTSGKSYRDTLGIAFEPGFVGMSHQDILTAGSEGAIAAIEARNWMVMAHEIGHNLNAKHEQADWFCRFWFVVCLNPAHTLMWPSYSFRTAPEFSRGFWDLRQNNRQTIITHLGVRGP